MKSTLRTLILLLAVIAGLNVQAADPAAVLKDLKAEIAPDGRTAIWNVNSVIQNGVTTIVGTVGMTEQKEAISEAMARAGISRVQNNVVVLEQSIPAEKRWALVKLSIASLRCEGKHSAEMATQAVMGTPVKVLEINGDWIRVQTPDKYISYAPESSLRYADEATMAAWRSARRMIVTVYDSRLVTQPAGDETVSDLVLGNILEYRAEKGKWVMLSTPDGRTGWVEKAAVQELDTWKEQNLDFDQILKTARRMMGSGYLWGGTSTKVTDCSGLVKVSYFSNGIILARDASQQALYGERLAGGKDWSHFRTGDLLFFGNSTTGRVTHVGIYLSDGKYIHCSGQVKINSLDPAAPDYLYSPLSGSRIEGQLGTPFVTQVKNHPWYF